MNSISPNISAFRQSSGENHAFIDIYYGIANSTTEIMPLTGSRSADFAAWIRVRQRLGEIARLPSGWNGHKAAQPDVQTITFANSELALIERLGIPAPEVNPGADGTVTLEWHTKGLDIEMIFEEPYSIVMLVEDAWGIVESFDSTESGVAGVIDVLRELARR